MIFLEHRIFGPPGTGKTTYLSKQIERAVQKYGSTAVIVSSFTNSAAQELISRKLPIKEEQIGTLHSHCYRSIGCDSELAETKIKEWNEFAPEYRLSARAGIDIDDPLSSDNHGTESDEIYQEMKTLRSKMVDKDMWPSRVKSFYDKWEQFKRLNYLIDFTDMIELALQKVDTAPGNPLIGFFDEVQDFTPLELSVIRKWNKHMKYTILAGDDDQCIYHFKGASPSAFLNPELPKDQKRILSQSFRVPEEIRKVSQRWISQVSYREKKQYKSRIKGGEVRSLSEANWKYADIIIDDMKQYLEQDKTVMVLTTCGYMLNPLKSELRDKGLIFHNPYRRQRGDWNPLGHTSGVSTMERVLAFYRISKDVWGTDTRMWTIEDLQKWVPLLKSKGNLKRGAKAELKELTGNRPLSIKELQEYIKDEALSKCLNLDFEWFAQNVLKSKDNQIEYISNIINNNGIESLNSKPSITIGTIHSVKGGESDVVYLFPDLSMSGMQEWLNEGESKDAIIRQFYVGMTRARESLILCSPATNYYVNLPDV